MVDALILVGILLTLLKASDLLVLREQQQVVEQFVETFTLRLAYFDEYVERETARSSEVQFLIFIGTILALSTLQIIAVSIAAPLFEFADARSVVTAINSSVFAVAVFLLLWKFPLKHLLVFRTTGGWTRLRGFLFLIAAWLVCLTALLLVSLLANALLGWNTGVFDDTVGDAPLLLLFGVFFGSNAIGQLLRKEKDTGFHLVCIALQPVLWRIVAFNKGVFPGIVAATTLLLALYKILVAL